VPACRICGAQPAADVTFTQGIGMMIMRRTLIVRGPLCRDCGQHIGRHYQQRTLLTGWWGVISFFLNFVTILNNTTALSKLRSMPEPTGGDPTRRQHPGQPMHLRPATWLTAAAFVALAVFILAPR
jgi:hypothetical protein